MRFFISIIWSCSILFLNSQMNFYEKGHKTVYWGISLGTNLSNFSVDRAPYSIKNDTLRDVSSSMGNGFNLGLIGNWQFSPYFDLRAIPSMVFSERIVSFQYDRSFAEQRVNSTSISLPVMCRLKSHPVKDWRLFLLGGIKYEYNIVSQKPTRADPDRILLKKHGLSYEYGVGLQYFFPYFIFSPEIKFSHSFFNMLENGQSPRNESSINGLFPRAFTLSLNFEG